MAGQSVATLPEASLFVATNLSDCCRQDPTDIKYLAKHHLLHCLSIETEMLERRYATITHLNGELEQNDIKFVPVGRACGRYASTRNMLLSICIRNCRSSCPQESKNLNENPQITSLY